jgi:hypothetical protein
MNTTTQKLRRYKVWGQWFKAHDIDCADGFKTDRRYGAIYGPYRYEDGSYAMTWEEASLRDDFCAYCGPHAEEVIPHEDQ